MNIFYNGVVVDALLSKNKSWVFINWRVPGEKKVSAVKDVRRIEELIKNQNLRGWYASSERAHLVMHGILKKMKAAQFREDADNLYFMKEVN